MTNQNHTIPEQNEPKLIARWESRGGVDGVQTEAEAIAAMQTRYVDRGSFRADANKTPMHRVEVD